jgi:hypothetical protein
MSVIRASSEFLSDLSALNQNRLDMKPVFDSSARCHRVRALGHRGIVILILFFGVAVVRADTTGFMDVFAPTNWSQISGSGTYDFTNSDSEIIIRGPNPPPSGGSFDSIQFNGHLGDGLTAAGTVQFDWQYDSPDDPGAFAQFGTSVGNSANIGPGGVGGPFSGTFTSQVLPQGATFSFLLFTDTPSPDKSAASLVITDFQFHDIPEPSAGVLVAGMLGSLGVARWRRARIQALGRCQASSSR